MPWVRLETPSRGRGVRRARGTFLPAPHLPHKLLCPGKSRPSGSHLPRGQGTATGTVTAQQTPSPPRGWHRAERHRARVWQRLRLYGSPPHRAWLKKRSGVPGAEWGLAVAQLLMGSPQQSWMCREAPPGSARAGGCFPLAPRLLLGLSPVLSGRSHPGHFIYCWAQNAITADSGTAAASPRSSCRARVMGPWPPQSSTDPATGREQGPDLGSTWPSSTAAPAPCLACGLGWPRSLPPLALWQCRGWPQNWPHSCTWGCPTAVPPSPRVARPHTGFFPPHGWRVQRRCPCLSQLPCRPHSRAQPPAQAQRWMRGRRAGSRRFLRAHPSSTGSQRQC